MAALFALGLFFAPLAAQEAPNTLYATNFGAPDPVAAGATITWTLQGLNEGTTALENVGWSSEQCGDATYPGPFEAGESTPLVTCESTAPAEGAATNTTQFTATVVDTGEVLTQTVTANVTVALPPPTTTAPTPPTTAGSSVNIGDAVQQALGAESSRRRLPNTGSDPAPLVAGLAAASAGAILLVTSRTRRR